jgi:hypothetical protein
MSIHGLLQQPASYPSNFITLPFTIPPSSENFGAQSYTSIARFLDADGFAVGMVAGTTLQQTEFDLGINVYLSQLTVTLHLEDGTNYNNVPAFGMVGWDYGTTSSRIIIFTYNSGILDITDWSIEVITFPIIQGGLWPTYKATDQNTSQSLFLGTPITPSPPVAKWTDLLAPYSFNDNIIVIGESGILYIAEDQGSLIALQDDGNSASILWAQDTGYTALASPALGRNNTLYIGGSNTLSGVSNINTATPSVMWTCNVTPLVTPFPPLVGYDSTGAATIYVSGLNGHVYAVTETGVYKWVFVATNGIITIALSNDYSVVYVVALNVLYAVNSVTGLQIWSRTLVGPMSPPSVSEDGTIYLYDPPNTLYAITDNGTTSTVKWSLVIGGLSSDLFRSISIGNNGRLYLVTNTQVLAVTDNGGSGTTNWVYNVPGGLAPGLLSSVTISLNGTLYITGDYTLILCLTDNGASATQNWGVQIAGGLASQFTIGLNQRCYLGNDQTGIICF